MFQIRLSKLFHVPESLATAFSRISWALFTLNLKQSLLSKASAILHNCQRVPEIDRNIPPSSVYYCFFSISRNDFLLLSTYHRWPIPSTGQSQCVPPFRSVPEIITAPGLTRNGKLPVLNLLTGQKSGFRPAGATRCTNSRQTWHGWRARGSAWLCKISPQSAQGVGMGPQNIKNFHFLVKSRVAGANPLTDF